MTITRLVTALAISGFVVAGAPRVYAQAPVEQMLSDANVKSALQNALENIQHGLCGEKQKCAPATKEELKNPPISIEQARGAVKAGIASGTMQWCDLSWNSRNFQPFLVHYQTGEGMSNRQIALMALIHGLNQKAIFVQLKKNGPCPPETAKSMSSQMPLENLEDK
jgi:hypothetical protein